MNNLFQRIDAVLIGASAGGVQALTALLPALPVGARAAIFIVLHLPRDKPSMLVDIFSSKCVLPVREAQDKEPVAAGTVYFAPTNYHLLIDHGPQIALSADDPVHHSRPSVDVLFESAAEVYRERALGLLLTGANDDGAAGLKMLSDNGAVTAVQSPATAQAPQMAQAALRVMAPDYILPLGDIAALLRQLGPRP